MNCYNRHMKIVRRISFILFGLALIIVGLFAFYSALQNEQGINLVKFGVVSLMMIGVGSLFVVYSDKIAEANEPHRVGKTNKYVSRQLLLFFVFVVVYIAASVMAMMKNPSTKTVMFFIGGLFIIVIALIVLAVRAAKFRKNTRVHDSYFKDVKIHENDSLFTMVIDCCWYEDNKMYMRGNVHGTVNIKDKVYFYLPDNKQYYNDIIGIEVEGNSVNSVSDKRATLIIKANAPIEFPLYTVCSSCISYGNKDLQMNITNPRVLALINDFEYQKVKEYYFSYVIDDIVHGRYLLRVVRDNENSNVINKTNDYIFGYNGEYLFATVESNLGNEALGIYTDWQSIKDQSDKNGEEVLALTFDEIYKEIVKGKNTPLVINPFNKNHFYLPLELINEIVATEGYQKEFERKNTDDK